MNFTINCGDFQAVLLILVKKYRMVVKINKNSDRYFVIRFPKMIIDFRKKILKACLINNIIKTQNRVREAN